MQSNCIVMRMSRIPHLAVFSLVAVHLLLFSICQVSGGIYRTNDAVIIEVDDFARSNSGNPPPIPMMYAVNPYTGLYYNQQPTFPFWPYPLYSPTSRFSDVENVTTTSPEYRQQNIPCGVGPDSPPQRSTPVVGIVGGSDAIPNSWPFIVGLRLGTGDVMCGGSIISPTRILTAAHCVNFLSVHQISIMTVSLGMHTQGNLEGTFNDAQMTRRVSRVVYHPNFNGKTSQYDVAVLTVDPPIVYSSTISPICLPPFNTNADQFSGKDAAIMGWGTLNFGGTQPNVLQQTTVQIISNAACNAQYGDGTILNQQICASGPETSTCQGDSGGPLVVQATVGSTKWTQVGIVSYAVECAKPDYSTVYASVGFFRNWIATYTNN